MHVRGACGVTDNRKSNGASQEWTLFRTSCLNMGSDWRHAYMKHVLDIISQASYCAFIAGKECMLCVGPGHGDTDSLHKASHARTIGLPPCRQIYPTQNAGLKEEKEWVGGAKRRVRMRIKKTGNCPGNVTLSRPQSHRIQGVRARMRVQRGSPHYVQELHLPTGRGYVDCCNGDQGQ